MSDLLTASIKDKLWHTTREDLAHYAPWILESQQLMCCACGRFLQREDFTLEHLIPQQALKRDPTTVRSNPDTSVNVRAGNLLLCKKPLKHNGTMIYRSDVTVGKASSTTRPLANCCRRKHTGPHHQHRYTSSRAYAWDI